MATPRGRHLLGGRPARLLLLLPLLLHLALLTAAAPGLFDGLRQSADGGQGGQPVVQVREGKLRGQRLTSRQGRPFLAFEGIPYAKPPVGDLRFRAPLPPEPWQGVRDATKEGSWCPQPLPTKLLRMPGQTFGRSPGDFLVSALNQPASKFSTLAKRLSGLLPSPRDFLDAGPALQLSEDCLWLNVFTPQTSLPSTSLLMPVFFNIPGGAFTMGGGSVLVYGPDYLVDHGLVVVSLNFRLGALGFLYSNTSDAPGNAGLKDQVQALRWVRDNIAAFGGDPRRVTIYGESAGGASVHYHMMSPMSRGLFSASIISSSSTLSEVYQPRPGMEPDDIVSRLTALFGGPARGTTADKVRFLRTLPALLLSMRVLDIATEEDFRSLVPALPVHGVVEPPDSGEPPFLAEDPNDLMATGRHARVPLIIGTQFREGTLFFGLRSESDMARVEQDPTMLLSDHLYLRLDEEGRRRAAQQVRDLYLGDQRASAATLPAIIDMWGDLGLVHGIELSARWHSLRQPVWRYHFTADIYNLLSQVMGAPQNVDGPGHADDLAYLFYSRLLGDKNIAKQEAFEAMRDNMVSFFANFCYYHNPTPDAQAHSPVFWPRYLPDSREYLDLGEPLAARRDLWPERMALWTRLHREVVRHPVYDPPG